VTNRLYTYDPEVVETRWRLRVAGARFVFRRRARLYLTAPWCVGMLPDWAQCPVCGPAVRALRGETP
jgi:hypothetical protein